MTRQISSSLLTSTEPTTSVPADVTIGHIQLRDLVICPHQSGIVVYPQSKTILEHDLAAPGSHPRRVAELQFIPNSLSTLVLPDTGETLLAAGGQEAELYLSIHAPASTRLTDDGGSREAANYFGRQRWKTEVALQDASINNSVLLTSLSLTESNESSAEPRVVISNNDRTVKFFDIAVRSGRHVDNGLKRLSMVGKQEFDVPVNHSSISPDGRTLLSVGDSPDVYLHRLTGGSRITFSPIAKLSLSPYISPFPSYSYTSYSPYHASTPVPASFSASFSENGSKFAVASQEGVVVVWDVRSTKPLKVIQTDKSRATSSSRHGTGSASGWMYESPWDWGRGQGKAPGWGVRSVKFSPRGAGREVLTFTEHTSLLHVMDARTFETEEIVRIPNLETPPSSRPPTARQRSTSPSYIRPPSSDIPLPPPPRIMLFSGALEETFRIPSADSTGRRRRTASQRYRARDWTADEDGEGIVVIPPLGDREVDDDVRRLFQGRHALRTHALGDDPENAVETLRDEDREDEMDVDELESDCLSSYNPSRAPSPAPAPVSASLSSPSTQSLRGGPALPTVIQPGSRHEVSRRGGLLERRESSGPYMTRRGSSTALRRRRRQAESEAEVDIAGTCFDPSGEYIYVASVKGISEWKVRGAEQSWWSSTSWA